jgi:hypothetical protein
MTWSAITPQFGGDSFGWARVADKSVESPIVASLQFVELFPSVGL